MARCLAGAPFRPAAFLIALALLPAAGPTPGRPAAPPRPLRLSGKELFQRNALRSQVEALRSQGKPTEAIAVLHRQLVLERQVLGQAHPDVAASLLRLAELQEARGDVTAGAAAYREAAAMWEKLLGKGHWQSTGARAGLSHCEAVAALDEAQRKQLAEASRLDQQRDSLAKMGKAREAVGVARQALMLRQKLLGAKDRDTASSLLRLAAAHQAAGELDAAEPLFRQAAAHLEELLGEAHPAHAQAVELLASFSRVAGKPAQAAPLYRRVLSLREGVLGKADPEQLRLRGELVQVLGALGDPARAEEVLRQGIETAREGRGRGDMERAEPLLFEAMKKSGGVLRVAALADLAAVHKVQRQALRRASGPKDASYQKVLLRHAELYTDEARLLSSAAPADHLQAHARVLQLCEEGLAPEHWLAVDARQAVARMDLVAGLDAGSRMRLGGVARLETQAKYLHDHGDYQGALHAAGAALQIQREVLGEGHPDYARGLSSLGMLRLALGEDAEAARLLRQAWALRQRALGPDHPQTAISLNGLGQACYALGDLVQAEHCLRRSLDVVARTVEPKHPAHTSALNNLAVLHQALGDHATAEGLLRRALDLQQQDWSDPREARSARESRLPGLWQALAGETNWVGALYVYGYYSSGSLEPISPAHLRARATFLNNIGRSSLMLGKHDLAEKHLREALALFDSRASKDKPGTWLAPAGGGEHAATLNNLALFYLARKDFDRAEPLLERSLQMRRNAFGEKHPAYAQGLTSLGGLCYAKGDWVGADRHFRRALEVRRQALGEQSLHFALSLSNLALLHDVRGETAAALPLARKAVEVTRAHLELMATVQSERQQLAVLKVLRGQLDHYLSLAVRGRAAGTEAYGPLLAWKGSVLARQRRLRERRLVQASGAADASRLLAELDEVARKLGRVGARQAAGGKEAEQLSRRREQLERDLAGKLAAAGRARRPERLTPEALQEALPRDVALVDFLEFLHDGRPGSKSAGRRFHLLAAVVRNGRPITLHDLGPAEPIRRAVDRWRGTLKLRRPVQGKDDPALELRRLLWAPLEKDLTGAGTVLVSPDGAVSLVPLAALPGKAEGKYLLEEVAVAVVPVPQALPGLLAGGGPPGKKPRPGDDRETSILLVGDVDFDAAPGPGRAGTPGPIAARTRTQVGVWKRLPGTRGEMLAVRDSFEQAFEFPDGQAYVLRGSRATESNFRREAPRHRWLHVATHGYFAPGGLRSALAGDGAKPGGAEGHHPGLLSGLVLAGANREAGPDQDDGVLTALEVAELDLGGVELAVLSACQTGLGATAGGEGLLGLQRAFQVAGARTVVASLWSVDDDATRKLMERFYESLWRKKRTRLEALREAQRAMLEGNNRAAVREDAAKEKDERLPPFYWAAFVLSGDWR
jgi:CHAT domain-containing protein/tetratricopeptide (TPR) repeat protein